MMSSSKVCFCSSRMFSHLAVERLVFSWMWVWMFWAKTAAPAPPPLQGRGRGSEKVCRTHRYVYIRRRTATRFGPEWSHRYCCRCERSNRSTMIRSTPINRFSVLLRMFLYLRRSLVPTHDTVFLSDDVEQSSRTTTPTRK